MYGEGGLDIFLTDKRVYLMYLDANIE